MSAKPRAPVKSHFHSKMEKTHHKEKLAKKKRERNLPNFRHTCALVKRNHPQMIYQISVITDDKKKKLQFSFKKLRINIISDFKEVSIFANQ